MFKGIACWVFWWSLCHLHFSPLTCTSTIQPKKLVLGFTIPWSQKWLVGPKIASAIILGIDEVGNRELLPGYEIDWIWRDSYCESSRGMAMAVDIWTSVPGGVDGIIGDGCSVVCQPVSLLAAAWGIPVVSWGCTSPSLSNKETYPTFTRVEENWQTSGPTFNGLADSFGWKKIAILTNPAELFKLTAVAVKNTLEEGGKEVVFYIVGATMNGDVLDSKNFEDLKHTLMMLKDNVFIFYFFGYNVERRNILIAAYDTQMLDGRYVFVIILSDTFTFIHTVFSYRPELNPVAFNGLITIEPIKPSGPEYDIFRYRVLQAFNDSRFDNMPYMPDDISDISPYAGKITIYNAIVNTRRVYSCTWEFL